MLQRVASLAGRITGRALGAVMIACVQAYRLLLSPLLPPSCRYMPTCSAYAIESIRRHGPILGGALTLRRLLRCHPWGGMGWDPVPEPGLAGRLWNRVAGRVTGRVTGRTADSPARHHSCHHP